MPKTAREAYEDHFKEIKNLENQKSNLIKEISEIDKKIRSKTYDEKILLGNLVIEEGLLENIKWRLSTSADYYLSGNDDGLLPVGDGIEATHKDFHLSRELYSKRLSLRVKIPLDEFVEKYKIKISLVEFDEQVKYIQKEIDKLKNKYEFEYKRCSERISRWLTEKSKHAIKIEVKNV